MTVLFGTHRPRARSLFVAALVSSTCVALASLVSLAACGDDAANSTPAATDGGTTTTGDGGGPGPTPDAAACKVKATQFSLPQYYSSAMSIAFDGTTTWMFVTALPGITVSYQAFTIGPTRELKPGLVVGNKSNNDPFLARVGGATRALRIAPGTQSMSLTRETLDTAALNVKAETRVVVPSLTVDPANRLWSYAATPSGTSTALLEVADAGLQRVDMLADGTSAQGLTPFGDVVPDAGAALNPKEAVRLTYAGATLVTAAQELRAVGERNVHIRVGEGGAAKLVTIPGASLNVLTGADDGFYVTVSPEARKPLDTLITFDAVGNETSRVDIDATNVRVTADGPRRIYGWVTPSIAKDTPRTLAYCVVDAPGQVPRCTQVPPSDLAPGFTDLTLRGFTRIDGQWAALMMTGTTLFLEELCPVTP